MGRTIATFHQLIEQTQARFAKFRRALRREDQQVFDELFARVKYYAASGSFEAAWEPLEVIFLAMLVAQQKEMRALAARLEILENPDADRSLAPHPSVSES
ncbi:MAG TPA: hypothetical protein VLB32_09080 [Candidatus Acidoferrales bacterium]|nr:hypothetical protein [Candidatus Acidoferrales bacterium]